MSVYTTLDHNDLVALLRSYDVGELSDFQGISDGIENTNYFVTTHKDNVDQQFVLTLFESLGFTELPYFLELMAYLSERGIPSAHPVADRQNHYLKTLKNKPAALVQRLPGRSILSPDEGHCRQMGHFLAELHVAGAGFTQSRDNTRGKNWLYETANMLMVKLVVDDQLLLQEEIKFLQEYQVIDIPRGVTHADLFRDNALFNNGQLTGIIDFYYACDDYYLYDLAVTVNDWCSLEDGVLNENNAKAMLEAYDRSRPVLDEEKKHWPMMLRRAALRFWLSRLYDLYFPRIGELTHSKNPDVFKNILIQRIKQYNHLISLWA